MVPSPSCGVCAADLVPTRLEAVEGRDGATRVRLRDFPVLSCPEGHQRRLLHSDFGVDLVDALFERGALPVVVETGFLWFRSLRCAACDCDLIDVEPEVEPVTGEISPDGIDEPIEITIETETLACPSCGLVQLRGGGERGGAVLEATADALVRASIAPS